MKNLVIALLFICSVSSGQFLPGIIAASGGEDLLSSIHPITHDQEYVVPSDVYNGDYLSNVHYNSTDSIFNDRSEGSYAWNILYGDPNDAFDLIDGMIYVNDSTQITGDMTLGVTIVHGHDIDTAECEIFYRTNCIYINLNLANGGTGIRLDPYGRDHDYSQYTGDTTILFARGSEGIINSTMYIFNNTGDWLAFAAYGVGEKPVFLEKTTGDGHPFILGVEDFDEATDADSVKIMDLKFYCSNAGVDPYDNVAIDGKRDSDYSYFSRIHTVNNGFDNAAISMRGRIHTDANHFFRDMQMDSTTTGRGLKCEAGGCMGENLHGIYGDGAFLYMGAYAKDSEAPNSWKYIYSEAAPGGSNNYPLDARDRYTSLEWFCVKDWGIGLIIQNYTYNTPHNITIKNGIIENCKDASFGSVYFGQEDDADGFVNIRFENLFIIGGAGEGITIGNSSCDSIYFTNCAILNHTYVGIQAGGSTDWIRITNSIFYGNDSPADDIDISSASGGAVRNTTFQTSDTDTQTNYDYDSGDPFEDKANGDYRTADGITAVIDAGTDFGLIRDIISDTIGIHDRTCFDRTLAAQGTRFNWTQR